jgi:hypothetical protein
MDPRPILIRVARAHAEILVLASSFSEETINQAPFEGSWTAAQVLDHVTKSNISILQSLQLAGSRTTREPDERAQELKKIFLDFSAKLKSPKFILPSQDTYDKEAVIAGLKNSIGKLKEVSGNTNLEEALHHPVFDEITKFELMYFVAYHTERHIHQLKNIFRALPHHR